MDNPTKKKHQNAQPHQQHNVQDQNQIGHHDTFHEAVTLFFHSYRHGALHHIRRWLPGGMPRMGEG
jgi:hypothetical protein